MPDTCPLCGAAMRAIARLGCYGCTGCAYWEELIVANNGTIVAVGHEPEEVEA